MKNTLYNVVKTLLVLFIISCTQDDTNDVSLEQNIIENEQSFIRRSIVKNEDLQNFDGVSDIIKSFVEAKEIQSRNSIEVEGFLVNTEDVLYIENTLNNNHSFTLQAIDGVENRISNIVINSNSSGGYTSYLIQHEMSENSYTLYTNEGVYPDDISSYYEEIDIENSILDQVSQGRSSQNRSSLCYYDQWTSASGFNYTSQASCGGGCDYNPIIAQCPQQAVVSIGVDGDDTNETGGGGGSSSNSQDDPYENDDPDPTNSQNGDVPNSENGGGGSLGNSTNPDDIPIGNSGEILTQMFWNGNLEESQLINGLNNLLEISLTDEQIDWVIDNQEFYDLITNYLSENQNDFVTINDALNSVITENSITPWENVNGSVNSVQSLQYSRKRTHLFPGGPVVEYDLINGDRICFGNYDEGSGITDKWFYWSNSDGNSFWYDMPEPDNYDPTDVNFIFNHFWTDLAAPVARYATPLEDIVILIDGTDFEGVEQSKAVAGVFVVVDVVGVGKIFKIIKKIGVPIVNASQIAYKISTEALQTQRSLVKEYKNIIELYSTSRKGNFAEMAVDVDLFEKGYKDLHINRVTGIDDTGHTGIDHIFKNEQTGEYFIVESKWKNTGMGSTIDDRQMSDSWILGLSTGVDRLRNALNNDILYSDILNVGYTKLKAKVQPDGSVIYRILDDFGFEISGSSSTFTP